MGRQKYGIWLATFDHRLDDPPGGWPKYLNIGYGNPGEWRKRYHRYLRSWTWMMRRNEVLQREGRCQFCERTSRLEIHHVHYIRLGCEQTEDLRCLCHDCHKKVEASGDRWVPVSPALRMEMERRYSATKEQPRKSTRRRPATKPNE